MPLLLFSHPVRVQLLVTPWTTAHQASLSLTISQSLPKFRSIESVMPSLKVLLLLFYMYAFLFSVLKVWPPTIYLYSSSLNMFEL